MKARLAFGLKALLLIATSALANHTVTAQQHPILIPGAQEPKELLVEPFPMSKFEPTVPERMLGEALETSDTSKPATLLPALNQVLAQYPDFTDGYFMRAFALCDAGSDRTAISADLNRAINSINSSRTGKESFASLLATRAKIEYLSGDYATAITDLEQALRSDLGRALEFSNSGGVKPEKTGPMCVWTEPDLDTLVQRFAGDYRPYMFRGLYHGFFLFFEQDEKAKLSSLSRAFEDFNAAAKINPRSVLPHLFKAEVFSRTFGLQMMNIYNPQHDALNSKMINLLDETLAIDPDNVWALKERALMYSHLKRWRQAITDYDKALVLDPKDFATLNDRALAKIEIGDTQAAILDLDEVIRNKERQLHHSESYQARADAYMKTRQWDLAVRDLTTAISLEIGGQVLLGNINQFRALYPEYRTATDEAVARKLQQTFYPNMKYEDFADRFLHKNGSFGFPDFVIADLYLKRLDASLRAGDWHAAKLDFRRAGRGYLSYPDAIDRWREIGPPMNARLYIDMKTFNAERREAVTVWVKQARDETGPYSVQQFELNCGARRTRILSSANYDSAGNFTGGRQGGDWAAIVPETLGEILYDGACTRN
jgi:tetratricopeptide (TPR) repeat protein